MNKDLIDRGDAIAIAMHSKDPVEGIKHLPAADAVEVVHAKWERDKKFNPYCTACGKDPLSAIRPEGNLDYCPNCGARMDGE